MHSQKPTERKAPQIVEELHSALMRINAYGSKLTK
jgi:hypothetical protein